MASGGRPSGFGPDALELAASGRTQPDIAAELGITNRTLSRWALQLPEFRAALDRGLARREAEQRAAETAPLREAASNLLRMVADAMAASAPTVDPATGVPPSPPPEPASTPSERARSPRHPARYVQLEPEPEPDVFDGEPIELLDPRSGW